MAIYRVFERFDAHPPIGPSLQTSKQDPAMADRISHDQNLKNLILDYPRDALSFFAAPEAPSPEDTVQSPRYGRNC